MHRLPRVLCACCWPCCRQVLCTLRFPAPTAQRRPLLTAQQVGSLVGMPLCWQPIKPVELAVVQALNLQQRCGMHEEAEQPIST